MRELLIRYLFGELSPEEHRQVRARLRENPQLRQELARLREHFEANPYHFDDEEPPDRLAERTSRQVSESDEFELSWASCAADKRSGTSRCDAPAGVLGWNLADLTVAGGVILAVSMLVFPALRDSRDDTRRNICQNNLREMWVVLADFAQDHGGYFPPVRPNETAGVYAARLVEHGYVQPEQLALMVVCPAAPLANEVRAGRFAIHIPAAEAIRALSASQLATITAVASPFYAYRFPYRKGSSYCDIRTVRSSLSPLLSDTSAGSEHAMSLNHGGKIIQVLSQDGSVRIYTKCTLPGANDDLFHNDLGAVAAGVALHDVVLAPSHAKPDASPCSRPLSPGCKNVQ